MQEAFDQTASELSSPWQQIAPMGYNGENVVNIFDRIFFILAGNNDNHNISYVFEIRPDRTKDCGVRCL